MALGRNILYVLIVLVFNFIIGFWMALLCNEKFPGKKLLKGIILIPMLLMPTSAATLWKFLYHPSLGIFNKLLKLIGLSRKAWLAKPSIALYAIIFTDIWSWTPWMFLILYAGLQSLDKSTLEAAKVDGATYLQNLWYMIIPMMKEIIFAALFLKGIDTFRTFTYVWVMTQGGPGEASHILSTYIYNFAIALLDYGKGSAYAIIVLVLSIILSIPVFMYIKYTS
jgi:multiple sugar transport system permease protein